MLRLWCSTVLGLALAAGCLLPEGSVDESLPDPARDPSQSMNALQGGASGSGGNGSGSPATPGQGGSSGSGAGTAGSGAAMLDPCPAGLTREQACNRYCDLYTQACSSTTLAPDPYTYENASNCIDVCFDSDWEIGTISQPNTIMCRCQHANFSITRGVSPHCYHSARVPSMPGGCEVPP